MKVLIIGKNGQVAWELAQTIPEGYQVLALARNEIDLTLVDSIKQRLTSFNPNIIINAAAYTAVDKAESEETIAYAINHQAVIYIAHIAAELNIKLIHISSDFIFDGSKNSAYQINDQTNPINIYGASKLAGEKAIQSIYPQNSIIIRTSWVYSSHGNNFVKSMLKLMMEKDELNIVVDQIGCPTYARGLAHFIWHLTQIHNPKAIYHWSDLGVASWYDFACVIQKLAFEKGLINKKIPITPVLSINYPTPAKRPAFSLLAMESTKLTVEQNYWQTNLEVMLNQYQLDSNGV